MLLYNSRVPPYKDRHTREALTCGPKLMAARGRTEPLANPTRPWSEVPSPCVDLRPVPSDPHQRGGQQGCAARVSGP
jgi:hypothetical protein